MTLKPGDLLAAVQKDVRQARTVIRARRRDLDQTIADAEAALVRAREEAAATSGPQRALEDWRRLAADAAPGLASAPWGHWVVEPEPSEAGPCLYRVGSVAGEIPALVPLLDAGHLRITGKDMAAADAVVDSLLVRIVATTRAGSAPGSAASTRCPGPACSRCTASRSRRTCSAGSTATSGGSSATSS